MNRLVISIESEKMRTWIVIHTDVTRSLRRISKIHARRCSKSGGKKATVTSCWSIFSMVESLALLGVSGTKASESISVSKTSVSG